MQAIPSEMPLSRTASFTSSVMSVTVRPPVVLRVRSSWKTFTGGIVGTEAAVRAAGGGDTVSTGVGPVAQRLEQRTHNPCVPGSNPGGPIAHAQGKDARRRGAHRRFSRRAAARVAISALGSTPDPGRALLGHGQRALSARGRHGRAATPQAREQRRATEEGATVAAETGAGPAACHPRSARNRGARRRLSLRLVHLLLAQGRDRDRRAHRRSRPGGDRPGAVHCGSAAGRPHRGAAARGDRKSTRLNSSHVKISYAVFCLKKNKK